MTHSPPPDRPDRTCRTESHTPGLRRLGAAAFTAAVVVLLAASAALAPAAAQSDGDTFDLETESLPSTAEATVTGTATLEPGTELRVQARSAGDTEPPLLRSTATTVGPDGAWNATFNLSSVDTHDRLSVTVSAADGDASETFAVSLRDDEAGASGEAPVSTPGFGVVVAVAALLGSAAVLARRRG